MTVKDRPHYTILRTSTLHTHAYIWSLIDRRKFVEKASSLRVHVCWWMNVKWFCLLLYSITP